MLAFCGYDKCILESNGRLRLNHRWAEAFLKRCNGEIVIHGLPEGAIAIYPQDIYEAMRARELGDMDSVAASFAARRSLRRFGALTASEKISAQGRVMISEFFREFADLTPGKEICVVGVEIGVEIWSAERFAAEMEETSRIMKKRSEKEFSQILNTEDGKNE
jgi:DNA-binding transcriptional regulator/RsmH inhibitor MraZ